MRNVSVLSRVTLSGIFAKYRGFWNNSSSLGLFLFMIRSEPEVKALMGIQSPSLPSVVRELILSFNNIRRGPSLSNLTFEDIMEGIFNSDVQRVIMNFWRQHCCWRLFPSTRGRVYSSRPIKGYRMEVTDIASLNNDLDLLYTNSSGFAFTNPGIDFAINAGLRLKVDWSISECRVSLEHSPTLNGNEIKIVLSIMSVGSTYHLFWSRDRIVKLINLFNYMEEKSSLNIINGEGFYRGNTLVLHSEGLGAVINSFISSGEIYEHSVNSRFSIEMSEWFLTEKLSPRDLISFKFNDNLCDGIMKLCNRYWKDEKERDLSFKAICETNSAVVAKGIINSTNWKTKRFLHDISYLRCKAGYPKLYNTTWKIKPTLFCREILKDIEENKNAYMSCIKSGGLNTAKDWSRKDYLRNSILSTQNSILKPKQSDDNKEGDAGPDVWPWCVKLSKSEKKEILKERKNKKKKQEDNYRRGRIEGIEGGGGSQMGQRVIDINKETIKEFVESMGRFKKADNIIKKADEKLCKGGGTSFNNLKDEIKLSYCEILKSKEDESKIMERKANDEDFKKEVKKLLLISLIKKKFIGSKRISGLKSCQVVQSGNMKYKCGSQNKLHASKLASLDSQFFFAKNVKKMAVKYKDCPDVRCRVKLNSIGGTQIGRPRSDRKIEEVELRLNNIYKVIEEEEETNLALALEEKRREERMAMEIEEKKKRENPGGGKYSKYFHIIKEKKESVGKGGEVNRDRERERGSVLLFKSHCNYGLKGESKVVSTGEYIPENFSAKTNSERTDVYIKESKYPNEISVSNAILKRDVNEYKDEDLTEEELISKRVYIQFKRMIDLQEAKNKSCLEKGEKLDWLGGSGSEYGGKAEKRRKKNVPIIKDGRFEVQNWVRDKKINAFCFYEEMEIMPDEVILELSDEKNWIELFKK